MFLTSARELCALSIWFYILCKLFVADIDVFLVQHLAPSLEWLLAYKALFFLGLLGLTLLAVRSWRSAWFVAFIAIYPLYVVFVRIPLILFRAGNWVVAVNVINTAAQFVLNVRYNVAAFATYAIAFTVAIASSDVISLQLAAIALVGCLLASFYRRTKAALSSDPLVRYYRAGIERIALGATVNIKPNAEISALPVSSLDEKQMAEYKNSLLAAVLYNRVCLFLARRMKDFYDSPFALASRAFSALAFWLSIVVTFGAVYVVLYKIEPFDFTASQTPSIFQFFRFSFSVAYFSSIPELSAASVLSQTLVMLEAFCTLATVTVSVGLLVNFKSQRANHDVDSLVTAFAKAASEADELVRLRFRFPSVDEAQAELQRLESGLMQVLLFLTRGAT